MDGNPAYQDEAWEELIDGKTVSMAPAGTNHVFVSGHIYKLFANYLEGKRCTPIAEGVTVYLTEKDHFVPDFMVVCDPDKIRHDGVHGAPDLAVEVLSPSTAARDKRYKKSVYAQCGVKEYWIVSQRERSVEQYVLSGGTLELQDVYTEYPDYMLEKMSEAEKASLVTEFRCTLFEDLSLKLQDIFYRVW